MLTAELQEQLNQKKTLAEFLIKGNEIAYVAGKKRLAVKGLKKALAILLAEEKLADNFEDCFKLASLSWAAGDLISHFEPPVKNSVDI